MVKAHAGAECQRCSTKCGQALNFSQISLGVFDCIEIYGISMGHPGHPGHPSSFVLTGFVKVFRCVSHISEVFYMSILSCWTPDMPD